jgi:hypothetical protein
MRTFTFTAELLRKGHPTVLHLHFDLPPSLLICLSRDLFKIVVAVRATFKISIQYSSGALDD